MPFAVTHILIPMILVDLIRDHLFKQRKHLLPNKFVLTAGLTGLLPDLDVPISYFLKGNLEFHRTITHSIFFPIGFFCLFLFFYFVRHKPFLWKFFLMCFVGFSLHVILDFYIFGTVSLFFPLTGELYGLNIFPIEKMYLVYSAVDAVLLFLWLVHEELEHKISDFF
jgi:membrane-bound metal-dependent hydrolase YbcI (DUF457 family)